MKYKLADKPKTQFAFAPTDNLPAKTKAAEPSRPTKEPVQSSRREFLKGTAARAVSDPESDKKQTVHHVKRILKSIDDHWDLDADDITDLAMKAAKHDHRSLKEWADRNEYNNKYADFRGSHPAWGTNPYSNHGTERAERIVEHIKKDFVAKHPDLNHKKYGGDMY